MATSHLRRPPGNNKNFTGNLGRLRRWTQHLLEVYSQESENLRSFSTVDSGAAQLDRVALASRRTGPFLEGRISRLVFSLVPRCQALCGSQNYTFTSVAT